MLACTSIPSAPRIEYTAVSERVKRVTGRPFMTRRYEVLRTEGLTVSGLLRAL